MDYWKNRNERAEHAREHTMLMETLYKDSITKSIRDSIILTDNASYIRLRAGANYLTTFVMDPDMTDVNIPRLHAQCEIRVEDVVTGANMMEKLVANMDGYPHTTTVLNFASSTNPGGMFMQGSSAQEESLCHRSTLYNVLSSNVFAPLYDDNQKHRNGGIYQDRGIWTPGIILTDDRGRRHYTVNVLTLPAPNLNAVYKNHGDREVANEAFRRRMRLLIDFVNIIGQQGLVLGAWGCGVFGWPASWVATMMRSEINRFNGKKLWLSIIDRQTADIFKDHLVDVPLYDDTEQKTI